MLTRRIATERDDPGRAKTAGGDDGTQPDGAVADNGDHASRLDPRAHSGVMASAHHVRQRQQRSHGFIRMTGAGDADQCAVGEGDAHRLALASVDSVIPK